MEKYIVLIIAIVCLALSGCSQNNSTAENQAYADNLSKVQKIAMITQNVSELLTSFNEGQVNFPLIAKVLNDQGYGKFNSLFELKEEVEDIPNKLKEPSIGLAEIEKTLGFVNLLTGLLGK